MKVYRTFVKLLALVLGISFGTFLFFSPFAQAAINEPVTEEYYEMLQGNAMNVARTLDVNVLSDKTLTADFYFGEDELVVTIKSFKAKVIANIPVSNYELNIEDGEFTSRGTVEFEKVEYENVNELLPAWWYIVMAIVASAFVAFLVWTLFFKAWT